MISRRVPLKRSRVKSKPTKRSTLKNTADRLWSAKVRAEWLDKEVEGCELKVAHYRIGEHGEIIGFPCSGPLQAAHGFSRRYLGTRYNPLNGFALCRAAHMFWTHRPLEWDAVLRAEWGETVYEELRQTALRFVGPLDYRLIADALR